MLRKSPTKLNVLTEDEEHEIVGPTRSRPIYKLPEDDQENEHEIVGPVYARPKLKAPYDLNVVKDILHVSQRFKNLKFEKVFQLLGERRKYDFLKKFAIMRLEEKLSKKLSIFYKMMDCADNKSMPSDELSHNIFSWNLSDFKNRRLLADFVWVDVLLRSDEKCLHIYKFKQDLQQLQTYIRKIFEMLYSNIGDEELDIYHHIEKSIAEAKSVLHACDNVEIELQLNTVELKQLLQKDLFLTSAKRDTEEKFLRQYLENRIWNSHIWDPIEIRYNLNWYRNMVEQNQYRMDSALKKYQRGINDYKTNMLHETFIYSNCMDFFFSTIEIYKSRINEMQEKYEKDLEIVENKLSYKRVQIDKLKSQHKWLIEEVERFHKEEEEMRIRLAKEEEERELERLKEEEKWAAKALVKQKKGKKSKAANTKSAATKGADKKPKVKAVKSATTKGGGKKAK